MICSAELIPKLGSPAEREDHCVNVFLSRKGLSMAMKHPIIEAVSEVMLRRKTSTHPHLPQTFQGNPYLQL